MSRRNRRKNASGPRPEKVPAPKPAAAAPAKPVIPDAPPMSGGRRRWVMWTGLAIYTVWLAWLAYLAAHSVRWTPGP
ncbi:MAG: hypothetical protein BIFFINMI_01318 [Phycisphaerae bacterium]|nr:hypothetical protein [Phycisphaerae bacterium]